MFFLELVDEFYSTCTDQEKDEDESVNCQEEEDTYMKLRNKVANHKIVQLKNNFIPKGLPPLERLLDKNDVPHKPIVQPK